MSIAAKIAKKAKPRERDIRKALKARVESYGGTVSAVKFLDENGAPDVLCQFPPSKLRLRPTPPLGSCAWVETKMGKDGKLSKDQEIVIDRLRSANQVVHVITTLNELDAWLPELPF